MAGAVAADPTPFWLRANVGPDWCGVHADLRRHVPTEVAVLVMLDAQPPTEQSSWVVGISDADVAVLVEGPERVGVGEINRPMELRRARS
jgi:hypothetical protein